jgi:hypothetical protein
VGAQVRESPNARHNLAAASADQVDGDVRRSSCFPNLYTAILPGWFQTLTFAQRIPTIKNHQRTGSANFSILSKAHTGHRTSQP